MVQHEIHHSMHEAMAAVRARLAEREEEQAQLLLERDATPESPSRRRRGYDRARHSRRAQIQSKIIDEGTDDYVGHLRAAAAALQANDVDGFTSEFSAAIDARVRDELARLKLEFVVRLIARRDDEEEENEED